MFDYLTPLRGGFKDIQSLLDPDLNTSILLSLESTERIV